MDNPKVLKERLVEVINNLPEDKLRELMGIVDSLSRAQQKSDGLEPSKDPILRFIGGVAHGSLAQDLDSELYGARS